jgi:hypothetical protein
MSDVEDDLDVRGRRVLRQSQVRSLRIRMQEFVDEASPSTDLEELRVETRGGKSLSTIVEDDREERL